ncbi:MAG: hypothetical protein ABS41_07925 [Arenimonas sp. SCN 70-307]|uniref:tetratricopeptide repeat protein n=1 Tax=Arenimonas sp. SCN 70-307 TaxID=1660089 RepID=UPI00086B4E5F|nr:tetratricopeptide repeat protein [Arenimonas sp. SCN 70-307]ODS63088.1 MAG: hypothetical protein ABS41_07925 [Arenimonas sp. SCN 70-307]
MNPLRLFRTIAPILLVLLAAAAYWPGLNGGFLFDDYHNIQVNPAIQLSSLDAESLQRAAGAYQAGGYGRPLATVSFALDHYFQGKDPAGFKRTNIALHALNTLLVFLLASRLLALPRAAPAWSVWAALAIAAGWAIHPLQVSTVLYVVQRMEILVATATLLGLLAYLRGRLAQRDGRRGWPWLGVAALCGAVGMLAKESAVLLPVFALALEATVLRFEAGLPATRRFLQVAYAGGAAIATVLFFGWLLPRFASPETFAIRDFTVGERLLTQLRVLPMYLGQVLLPLPDSMTFYYDTFPKSTGWFSPVTTLLGGVFLVALAALAWRLRRGAPLASLGILWFFAGHLLTSGPLNLELVFEHRNYLAMFGIVLAVADGVRRLPMQDGEGLKIFGVAAVLVLVGALTLIRAATWGHPLLLASDLVARNPDSPRASNDLAMIYVGMSDGDPDSPFLYMGMQEFERGSRLPGASPLPEQGLLLMAAVSGYPTDPAWWDRLEHKIRTQPLGPQQVMAVQGLLTQHLRGFRVDPERLARAYQAMLDRGGFPGHAYATFADFVLVELGDEARANELFAEAVAADPTDARFAMHLLETLQSEGRGAQARAVLERMQAIGMQLSPNKS